MSQKVHVYVGTSKGGFMFESDRARKKWKPSDIQFKGWTVMHMRLDPRDRRLHAATAHFVYGPTTHYSDDFGKTWTSIVVQGIGKGEEIVKYLDFVGKGLGFNVVKGCCLKTLEPMTEKSQHKFDRLVEIQSKKSSMSN
jgi:hypothetical protein